MLPQSCQIALKEWAVTVEALDRGQQVVLVRKGGIREEHREFRVRAPQFLLYPTYEHQKEELLKPPFQESLRHILAAADGVALQERVTFTHWAMAEEVMEVTQQEQVERLSPCHMWTTDYAQKRLHWKPKSPLLVLALRVYRLERPVSLPVLERYAGCTSWVEMEEAVPLGAMTPVLGDGAFQERVEEIRQALGLVEAASRP